MSTFWKYAGNIIKQNGVFVRCEECPCESESSIAACDFCADACPVDQPAASIAGATGTCGGGFVNINGNFDVADGCDPEGDAPPDQFFHGNVCGGCTDCCLFWWRGPTLFGAFPIFLEIMICDGVVQARVFGSDVYYGNADGSWKDITADVTCVNGILTGTFTLQAVTLNFCSGSADITITLNP